MKKYLKIIVAVLLITVILSLVGCKKEPDDLGEEVNPFIEGIGDPAPESVESRAIDASKVSLSSDFSSDLEIRESASYLFDIANYNIINTEYWTSVATGDGTAGLGEGLTGSMEVRDIYIKDGTKSYMETFGRIVKASEAASFALKTLQNILDYGKIRYTSDCEKIYYMDGGSKCLDASSVKNFLTITDSIYIENIKDDERHLYTTGASYFAENDVRTSLFEIDNALITAECVEDAKITHDSERGLYTVTMNIDPKSEALDMGRSSLRKSAGSKDLDYVYQQITIELWDNGLMRAYKTNNSWKATIVIFSGTSVNQYERYFGYDKSQASLVKMPEESEMTWLTSCK